MFEGTKSSGNVTGGMDAQKRWEQSQDDAYDENEKWKKFQEEEARRPAIKGKPMNSSAMSNDAAASEGTDDDEQSGFLSDEDRKNFFQSLRETSE